MDRRGTVHFTLPRRFSPTVSVYTFPPASPMEVWTLTVDLSGLKGVKTWFGRGPIRYGPWGRFFGFPLGKNILKILLLIRRSKTTGVHTTFIFLL